MTYIPHPVEKSVRRWLVNQAPDISISASAIIYGRQNAPRPASDFILLTPIEDGTPYEGRPSKITTTTSWPLTSDYTLKITQRQRWVFQLDVFKSLPQSALDILAASLDDPLTQEQNYTADATYPPVWVDRIENIRNTSDLEEGDQYRDRMTCEVVVYANVQTDRRAQAVATETMTLDLE